jgi:N-acetylmuramic acid 6-phosphate etherase
MSEQEFIDRRLTEKRNPRSSGVDVASPEEIVDLIYEEDKTVADAVHAAKDSIARTIGLAEASLRNGGRVIYVGAGTSGRLGVLDASECPPTFGVAPGMFVGIIAGGQAALVRSLEGVEDDRAAAVATLSDIGVTDSDLVVGIAASGTTPFVASALSEAARVGCSTAMISCSPPLREIVEVCDELIEVPVGPELLTGSTRLKAGTATKMVLNMISTGALLRMGKAYGNLMVDLMATSAKLVDRGRRIVMEVCGVDRQTATGGIEAAGGSVKLAIVMIATGLGKEDALNKLESEGGVVRRIIGDPPPVSE